MRTSSNARTALVIALTNIDICHLIFDSYARTETGKGSSAEVLSREANLDAAEQVLRRDADGNLLGHVIGPETVAAAVAGAIETGDAEVDIVEP